MRDSKVAMILEDINKKFDVICKWQNAAQPKLDKIDSMEQDIQEIRQDIALIKDSLKLKTDIDRIEKIEQEVNLLKAKVV
jgi:hypothetical protein